MGTPGTAGLDLANWNWRAVQRFVQERFAIQLSCSSCLNYLHRIGFVLKRPKKRLVKADNEKRKAFVADYAALRVEAKAQNATIVFVDEAHFRADVDLRGKWVLRGEPALVDSTSPRLGEKATYYSSVCLESGHVESMAVAGHSNAATSVAFLQQLRDKHNVPLIVIWDNAPAHRGQEMRAYLASPDLRLRLIALPAYSPDFNADEAIWDWARDEATANTCFGTADKVRERLDAFFASLSERTEEIKRRCRRNLQAMADATASATSQAGVELKHVDLTLGLV